MWGEIKVSYWKIWWLYWPELKKKKEKTEIKKNRYAERFFFNQQINNKAYTSQILFCFLICLF